MVSRIKQLLDWQQLSPTQFADRIGIGRPVISHILSERNKPSLDVVQRILAAFPELSTTWLIRGEGNMLAANEPVTPPAPVAPVAPPIAAAPVVPAAPFKPSPAPVQPAAASPAPMATLQVAVDPPAELVSAPVSKAVPRPAIPRFSPARGSVVAQPALASVEPVLPSVAQETPAVALPAPAASVPMPAQEPLEELPAQPSAPVAAVPATPAAPSLADMFGDSGKAIRRIVIFYRDGSFADYQPEG